MSTATLFSTVAREYAEFRPGYPPGLFEWLARACQLREIAWDCGCGSGQASIPLAAHFDRVHATDAAPAQIRAATTHPKVTYSVAPAERSGLADASVDVVTVAQALHWFDVEAFHAEARRVMRPGALVAEWTYPRPQFVDPALDRVFGDFHAQVMGPYWPPERRHVEAHYRTLPAPPAALGFEEVKAPDFSIELQWPLQQVTGYVRSWSATARFRERKGMDPVPLLLGALAPLWPRGVATVGLRMPLVLRAARLAK